MDFKNIDKEKMIDILLKDGRIDTVRDAIVEGHTDSLPYREILNYCSEEDIIKLLENEGDLLKTMETYSLNKKIIDIIIEKHFDYKTAIKEIIKNYTSFLSPKNIELLVKNSKYKTLISDNLNNVNDESSVYISENNLMPIITHKQITLSVANNVKRENIYELDIDRIGVLAYTRKFTKEELDYVIEKIFNFEADLFLKGYMDTIIQTQIVPDNILYKMVTEWEFSVNDMCFRRLLSEQKLDIVMEYILENIPLNDKALSCVLDNERTSAKSLIPFYEKYGHLLSNKNPKKMPVLDSHIHYFTSK